MEFTPIEPKSFEGGARLEKSISEPTQIWISLLLKKASKNGGTSLHFLSCIIAASLSGQSFSHTYNNYCLGCTLSCHSFSFLSFLSRHVCSFLLPTIPSHPAYLPAETCPTVHSLLPLPPCPPLLLPFPTPPYRSLGAPLLYLSTFLPTYLPTYLPPCLPACPPASSPHPLFPSSDHAMGCSTWLRYALGQELAWSAWNGMA